MKISNSHCERERSNPEKSCHTGAGRYPVFRIGILITAFLPLATSSEAHAQTLRSKLTEALKTYCVPPSGEVCADMAARYQSSSCYCGDPDYMYYDREARSCRVRCPAGQIARKASVCPSAGFGGRLVKDF
jgi:hypothetical protein